VKVKIF